MKTNILKAINNLIDSDLCIIKKHVNSTYKIRINNAGEFLEHLIKNSLSNNLNLTNKKNVVLQNGYFSYIGNQNNPPDLIIKNGDALEIKKIENNERSIALNSSFPKDKLYRNSSMITNACKNCEKDWNEKDICYVIGCIDKEKNIKSLWFIYGNCFCASPEIYKRVKYKIRDGIQELGIELSKTNEIAKVKKVDPLGITDLRVRGMWGIKHPSKVFEYIITKSKKPHIKALMLQSKFFSFDIYSRNKLLKKCSVKEVKIQNPNNPANLLDAILIEYELSI